MSAVRFMWTEEQKESVVPGATVVIEGEHMLPTQRYKIASSDREGVLFEDGAHLSLVPWFRCDPSTLNLPPDPRQGNLFGGGQ